MEADAATAQEIADQSGIEVGLVQKILGFLTDFGLVRIEGSRMVIEQKLLGLPRD